MHLTAILPFSILVLTAACLPTATKPIKRAADPTQEPWAAATSALVDETQAQAFDAAVALIADGPDPNGGGNIDESATRASGSVSGTLRDGGFVNVSLNDKAKSLLDTSRPRRESPICSAMSRVASFFFTSEVQPWIGYGGASMELGVGITKAVFQTSIMLIVY
ncbi:hypothetical protein HO133_007218 [Letharia lupina]|uniref:Uncharacterized protein n=1 Tax=Letharia lupina TaxID=560253 RepID=A0A8H6FIC5_9LECA|nr:uncharacterized protein HO133_007218 [Letharia lupina]KAF6229104.1 hypothetical protein HO133_007218 [Letharia lupina]